MLWGQWGDTVDLKSERGDVPRLLFKNGPWGRGPRGDGGEVGTLGEVLAGGDEGSGDEDEEEVCWEKFGK